MRASDLELGHHATIACSRSRGLELGASHVAPTVSHLLFAPRSCTPLTPHPPPGPSRSLLLTDRCRALARRSKLPRERRALLLPDFPGGWLRVASCHSGICIDELVV